MTRKSRKAVYAGSFNPFTKGHMDILLRGLELFDNIVLIVGVNINKPDDADTQRLESLRQTLSHLERVEVMAWDGLTVDAARKVDAQFLLRGVRSVADYEYERNLADINRHLSGIETVILFARPELAMVSSSMVRELRCYGHDVSEYIP